jgi:hypothetical protein
MIRVLVVCDCCDRTADPGTGDPVLAASVGAKRWTVQQHAPPGCRARPEDFEHYCPACVDRRAGLAMLAQLVEDLRDDADAGSDDDP